MLKLTANNKMKKIKSFWQKIEQPTPKNFIRLGYALLGVSTFVSASAVAGNVKWLAYTALAVGALGKFLTDFFTEKKE